MAKFVNLGFKALLERTRNILQLTTQGMRLLVVAKVRARDLEPKNMILISNMIDIFKNSMVCFTHVSLWQSVINVYNSSNGGIFERTLVMIQ